MKITLRVGVIFLLRLWYDEDMEMQVTIILILVVMFILGSVLGSFACCQAWRWRYRVLGKKEIGQWSVCLHCKKRIKWYDNIPVLSWLMLRGKCRYCHKKIGVAEFVSEVSLGVAFLMLSWAYLVPILNNWGVLVRGPEFLAVQIGIFLLTLVMLVVLAVLAVYDAKWGQLPTVLLMLAIIFGAMVAMLRIYEAGLNHTGDLYSELINILLSVVILALPCFVIYKASHEKLMGGGDWLLALALALALSDWWLALWAIFLANLLGDIIALPGALKRKGHVVHFGPFLVAAFVIVLVLGNCLPLLLQA